MLEKYVKELNFLKDFTQEQKYVYGEEKIAFHFSQNQQLFDYRGHRS